MFAFGISHVSSRFMSLIIIAMFSLRMSYSKADDAGKEEEKNRERKRERETLTLSTTKSRDGESNSTP